MFYLQYLYVLNILIKMQHSMRKLSVTFEYYWMIVNARMIQLMTVNPQV